MSAASSFERINNKIQRDMREVDVFYSGGKFLARLAGDTVGGESQQKFIGRYDARKPEYSPEYLEEDMIWAERVML